MSKRRKRKVPERVAAVLDLRASNAASPVPGNRRRDPRVRGGRAGRRTELRKQKGEQMS